MNVGAAPNNLRFYHYGVTAGRSYCAEQIAQTTPTTDQDGYVEVRRADQTTVIGSGDDVDVDPGNSTFSVTPGLTA